MASWVRPMRTKLGNAGYMDSPLQTQRYTQMYAYTHTHTHTYKHTYIHTYIKGVPIKSIPYNLLLITDQLFKLILQYFAGVLNVYINIYLPSYMSLRLIMRKIL